MRGELGTLGDGRRREGGTLVSRIHPTRVRPPSSDLMNDQCQGSGIYLVK